MQAAQTRVRFQPARGSRRDKQPQGPRNQPGALSGERSKRHDGPEKIYHPYLRFKAEHARGNLRNPDAEVL